MTWWIQLLACLVASASFSALMHQPLKTVPVSSLIAVAGYSVFLLLSQTTLAYFLATLLIGILCEIFARVMKRAATLFVTSAIVPLVPGVGLYNTMRHVVEGHYSQAVNVGAATILGLCGIALAITMSSVLFGAFSGKREKKERAE